MIKPITHPDVKLANQILKFHMDVDGFVISECVGNRLRRCDVLTDVLGPGIEGEITEEERQIMEAAGFSKLFIKTLAGNDGLKALQWRVSWLADHALKKWWRWNKEDTERASMISELGEMGPLAASIAPKLFQYYTYSSDEIIFWQIAEALGKMGEAIVPLLIEALKSNDPIRREDAASILRYVGPKGVSAIPHLSHALLEDERARVRLRAAQALGQMGSNEELIFAIFSLIQALEDEYWDVGVYAAIALGNIGAPLAIPAIPKLKNIIREPRYSYRHRAAQETLDKLKGQVR